MRCLAVLLLVVGVVVCDDLTEQAEAILDSVGLSDGLIAQIKPKNVNNVNEKLRQFVAGNLTLANACKGTAKTNLCQNSLKKPLTNLKTAYATLQKKIKNVLSEKADEVKASIEAEVDKAKDKVQSVLDKLKGNSILQFLGGKAATTTTQKAAAQTTVKAAAATTTTVPAGSPTTTTTKKATTTTAASAPSMDLGGLTDLLGGLMNGGLGDLLGSLTGGDSSGLGGLLGGLGSLFGKK